MLLRFTAVPVAPGWRLVNEPPTSSLPSLWKTSAFTAALAVGL